MLPTSDEIAALDPYRSPFDGVDSVGALPGLDELQGDDELSGVEAEDLLSGHSDFPDEVGWGFGSIRKGLKKAYKAGRKLSRAKAFRVALGGAAIAFPALAPAAVALEAANQVASRLEAGDEAARRAIAATKAAAQRGDPAAARTIAHVANALRARHTARAVARRVGAPTQPSGPVRGVLIASDGTRLSGTWVRA